VESIAETVELPTLGQVLGDERERQGLSRSDIAQRLHMSAWQVDAIEAGDYSRLPKGTFLRGFVRNYARLLGLDPAKVLPLLAEAAPKAPAPGIVVPSQNIRFDPLNERFASPYMKAGAAALALLVIGFAAMYWWVAVRNSPPPGTIAKKAAETAPQNIAAAPQPPPQPQPQPQPQPPQPAAEEAKAPTVKPQPAVAKAEPPKAKSEPASMLPVSESVPGNRLKFRFKGPSWVEIKDGRGRVLLSKLNSPGSETEVSGRPPFEVVVGNAPDVVMTYNDREFPLEPHTRVAVARFTVE
jgi:cytoskeleton protein RodZ